MSEEIVEPWGVNVPFIYLATIMFLLGGISLHYPHYPILYHPYLMTIGAYALYFGMIQRLFFPAKKYLVTQILSLVLLAIPLSHYFQFLASVALIITEIMALRDLKRYGSKFPINVLVLSSPFLSAIMWFLYLNYWSLIIPLLVYLLGVNIGVFAATLGAKPFFDKLQIPILLLSLLTLVFPFFLPITLVIYFAFLFRKRVYKILSITSLSVVATMLITTFSSLYLGDITHKFYMSIIHAFYLGVMFPLFFSCITYSTARYNHSKVVYVIPLLILAYYIMFVNLEVSGLFLPIAYLYFLYLIKDTLGITGIKMGISPKYLKRKA